jgi:hypothetical protein
MAQVWAEACEEQSSSKVLWALINLHQCPHPQMNVLSCKYFSHLKHVQELYISRIIIPSFWQIISFSHSMTCDILEEV